MALLHTQLASCIEQRSVSFGKDAERYRQHYAAMPLRELFYYLINEDEFPSVRPWAHHWVEKHLQQTRDLLASPETVPARLQAFTYTSDAFTARMAALYPQQLALPPLLDVPFSTEQLHYVLKQYAPAALLDGCWLQNISTTATNHTAPVARLFQLYADRIGDGDTAKHYGKQFQDLLRSARISLPEVSTRLFSLNQDVDEDAFAIPVFQLALSLFPRVYLPELIGFTLGHLLDSQDRVLRTLPDELLRHGLDGRYCQHYQLPATAGQDVQLIQEVVGLYLEACSDETERQQQWQRIWSGLVVHARLGEGWMLYLQEALLKPTTRTPHQKMVALMHAKVPYARNLHRNRKVGGQLINDWFAQDPFDAEGFLTVLAASPYINVREPHKSLLLTRSINFGGPMFRIFTDAEQTVMLEWVESLGLATSADTVGRVDVASPAPPASKTARPPLLLDDAADLATYARCSKRELYYHFVNADLYSDVLPTARKVAQQFFTQARADMHKRRLPEHLHLFNYSHEAFEARIRQIYDMEINAYEAFVAPSTVPREIMVWFTQQYAPFPMVDGSWVQHIAKAGMSHTEVSARLFRIYSDEVGNADTVKNHPNVYRQLLRDEGIDMPPTDALAFAQQPEIRDFAFDLPLLTLSVSLFPKAFLPEIIGVNLAIELSGLGKGYMQIIDELKYWKMNPYFFILHLTIDNIASGHTAVAMETVHLYLDQILATQGQQAMQREWERIWVGYLAFRQNMTRFDATLERQASLRFLLPLIRQNLKRGKDKKRKSMVAAG
ncbi:iron-containing redox enzyme family protein [Thiothrix lacustris]|uniref:iron-containing redox enzyme family protein n=1 Tax=Thiothrix lacustris TaxID=525917 RepID=UPI0027E586CB|nr:iron-containing redox enzyme family protein [Thiothrix lacustris]WMP19434.1 iron-containing redox enzyme family protein [Thiothrix lacustris]